MMQQRRHGRPRQGKPRHFNRPRTYKVPCSACGKEFLVEALPQGDKKLLCMECFKK
jgi:CxxC-x17-CxxC domain-containing protein